MRLPHHLCVLTGVLLFTTTPRAFAAIAPTPVEALSMRSHGGVGNFGIPLQIWINGDEPVASPPVECRRGSELTIVAKFDKAISALGSAVLATAGAKIQSAEIIGGQVVLGITGVANTQVLTIRMAGLTATDGGVLDEAFVGLRVLQGDVSGDGHVNTSDINQLRANAGTPINASNCRYDVSGDGYVNTSDLNQIRSWAGSGIAPLPSGDWGIGGDSRSVAYNSGTRDSRYPHMWTEQLLKGALTFRKTNVSSLGGITSSTFVASYLNSLLQKPTVGSIVLIGANDLASSVTEAQTKANIDTIVAAHRTANKALVLLNEYPFQTFTTTQLERHLRIRDHIDAKHAPVDRVWVINSWDAMTTSPRGFVTRLGYLKSDNVHPTPRGAAAMGKMIGIATSKGFSDYTFLPDRPNPRYNPNSWSGWSVPSVPGLTVSDVVVDGIAIRKLVFNNVAGTTGAVAQLLGPAQLPAGFVPGISKVDSIVGYELKPGSAGFASLSLLTFYIGGTFLVADETGAASDGSDGGSANREYFPNFFLSGVLHPARGTLPVNANRVQQLIQISGRSASEPITGEIWLYQPQLRAF